MGGEMTGVNLANYHKVGDRLLLFVTRDTGTIVEIEVREDACFGGQVHYKVELDRGGYTWRQWSTVEKVGGLLEAIAWAAR